jgi:L-threonylcarbamoyladenylate synthase
VSLIDCVHGFSAALLTEMQSVIRHDGVLAAATESSYALCGSPWSEPALERITRLKGRPSDKPVLVLIHRLDDLARLTSEIPESARVLMQQCWPGPLTIVLPAHPSLPPLLTADTQTVGIRLSGYRPLVPLLDAVGPLTGTSANRSGRPPLTDAQAVYDEFGSDLNAVLDMGPAPGGAPSTVVQVEAAAVRLLRAGPLTASDLRSLLEPTGIPLIERTAG